MIVKFDDRVSVPVSQHQLEQLPLLQNLFYVQQKDKKQITTTIRLKGVESFLFVDLLKFHTLSSSMNETLEWLMAQTTKKNCSGYIRDLFALNVFLNNESQQQDEIFKQLFLQALSHTTNEKFANIFFGLEQAATTL